MIAPPWIANKLSKMSGFNNKIDIGLPVAVQPGGQGDGVGGPL